MSTSMHQEIEQEREAFLARVGRIALAHIGGNGGKAAVADSDQPAPPPPPPPPPARDVTGRASRSPNAVTEWSPTLDCGRVNHEGAQKAVAKLNEQAFQGHTHWRLPEIRELLSLVDYSRTDPAIDVERFPDTKSAWYWTATPYAGVPGCAWIVHFDLGGAYWYHRGDGAFVRAVRGPVARARQ